MQERPSAHAPPGRFTQPDPIGLAGGLNLYGYAGGDPVNRSDPFGLFDVEIEGKNSRMVIDYLRANSSTFSRLYDQLNADPSVRIRVADGLTNEYNPKNGAISFSVTDLNYGNQLRTAATDGKPAWIFTAAAMMAHEFAHAGAFNGKLPEQCKDDEVSQCAVKYENRVRQDLPANARGGERASYSPTRTP